MASVMASAKEGDVAALRAALSGGADANAVECACSFPKRYSSVD